MPSPTPSSNAVLHYVALGDSWVQGNHCGGCRTFAGRYATGIEALSGRTVEFRDLTGDRTTHSGALLGSLHSDAEIRSAVAIADVVMIATGPNEMGQAVDPYAAGTCGGADGYDCIRELGQLWAVNFDAALTEIEALREGKPTAIRLVNAANPFISDPGMITELGLTEDFTFTGGNLLVELLTTAICDAALEHGAECVDVRPIINGPNLDHPGDENSITNMQAIADALSATGLPELGYPPPTQ